MQRRLLPLLLPLVGLTACASVPLNEMPGEVADTPAEVAESKAQSGSAEAIRELVESSRTSRTAGDYPQALASIERAIRIEPRNPYLWIELAETHLSRGNAQQAAATARKAMSVAGADRVAKMAAEGLLERAMGP
ncbi:MAG: tetratricopeptide repeat protein [Woeseiaceae bacterium]|nr:tetratricopeptide repeat protein [Woeseiaceae bacterium]